VFCWTSMVPVLSTRTAAAMLEAPVPVLTRVPVLTNRSASPSTVPLMFELVPIVQVPEFVTCAASPNDTEPKLPCVRAPEFSTSPPADTVIDPILRSSAFERPATVLPEFAVTTREVSGHRRRCTRCRRRPGPGSPTRRCRSSSRRSPMRRRRRSTRSCTDRARTHRRRHDGDQRHDEGSGDSDRRRTSCSVLPPP
jgi:hypothetical protein